MPPNLRDPAVFHELHRRWASTDGLVAALLQRHGASCWSQQMTGHGDTVALASGKALYSLHRTDDGLVGAVMLLSSAMGPPMSSRASLRGDRGDSPLHHRPAHPCIIAVFTPASARCQRARVAMQCSARIALGN